jgi:hypothetical protein
LSNGIDQGRDPGIPPNGSSRWGFDLEQERCQEESGDAITNPIYGPGIEMGGEIAEEKRDTAPAENGATEG